MPKKRRTRTFYPRQIRQLRYLSLLALHEAMQGPMFPVRRYLIEVKCGGPRCGIETEVRGAVEAIEFLAAHNHHRTWVKGRLIFPGQSQ